MLMRSETKKLFELFVKCCEANFVNKVKMGENTSSKDLYRCCVVGCETKSGAKRHEFPKNEVADVAWVKATGNSFFSTLAYSSVYKKRYVICHVHFKPDDYLYGLGKRLKNGVVPSLFLPDSAVDDVQSDEVCIDNQDESGMNVHNSFGINVTPSSKDFSPVKYRQCTPSSGESVRHVSVPNLKRRTEKLAVKKALFSSEENDIAENIPEKITATIAEKEPEPLATPESTVVSMEVNDIAENNSVTVPIAEKEPEPPVISDSTVVNMEKEPEPSASNSTDVNVEVSNPDHSSNGIETVVESGGEGKKSRKRKRVAWKRTELDDKTREMYKHVLEARKQSDNYRTKSLRYSMNLLKNRERFYSKRKRFLSFEFNLIHNYESVMNCK